ncbi:MAG: chemotaxis-specific protein-glutamate methyltransferase CheB [Bacteroidetes bacterium]|nr:chemotaxis-specific protein-glutamate methyltransferase CheB [Bacteroidota bacterium]
MIKVLIVEDSPVMQELLAYTIQSDPDFNIVDIVSNGEDAIDAVMKKHPDIIAMDCYMPKLDGRQATRIIMETNPTPIVIVTGSITAKDVAINFALLEAGAVAIIKKPQSLNHPEYKKDARKLIDTLKLMSEVKVVTRFNRTLKKNKTQKCNNEKITKKNSDIKIIAIGASTGGPKILQKIICGLPKNIPVPILIVQHISQGFTKGFVEWLKTTTNFPLHLASHGERALPRHGYIAPYGFHMGIDKESKIILSEHEPENGLKPSVAFLFRTVANIFGSNAIGILLTGMGQDGAKELKLMKDKGSITIAQNEESSAVFGMPGEAIRLNAAMHILSPEEILNTLTALFTKTNGD